MSEIFFKRIPRKLRIPLLVIAMFPHFIILAMFNMNSTFTASFLDIEADDIQFLFSIAYGMIVCGLFIQPRFHQYFNVRAFLILMTCISILLLLAMTLTNNTNVLIVLRFLQGPSALFEGAILLPILMGQLKSLHAKVIGYSILYCSMMTTDKYATSIIKFAIENYDYNTMIYTLVILHALSLFIYMVILNHNRMFPRKPMYQLNISGIILLMVSMMSGAYFFIYGKKYDWFDSAKIVSALAACLIFGAFFILYQRGVKRPLFHFEIFKSERVVVSMLLFFIFYILRASLSNVYQVMAQVWNWPWTNILEIQYYNVAGTTIGVLIAVFLQIKTVPFKYIFSGGFLLMAASMLWFSFLFYPDVSPHDTYAPLLIEGLSQGIIFTPLVMYMLGGVHPNFAGNAGIAGTAARFWTSIIGFSLMQNLVLRWGTQNQTNLSANLDVSKGIYQEQFNELLMRNSATNLSNDAMQLTVETFKNDLVNQALLLTNIDIFRYLFYLALITALLCLFYNRFKRILGYSI